MCDLYMKKIPLEAQFCTVLASLSIIAGGVLLIGGLFQLLSGPVLTTYPSAMSMLGPGVAFICSGAIWVVAAKGITLLAQIEFNSRRP